MFNSKYDVLPNSQNLYMLMDIRMAIAKEKYNFVVYLTYSMAHDFAVCFHQ